MFHWEILIIYFFESVKIIVFIGETNCYKSYIDLPKFFLNLIICDLCKNPETYYYAALANFLLRFSTLC